MAVYDPSVISPEDALRCHLLTIAGVTARSVPWELSEFAVGVFAYRELADGGYVHALVEWQPLSLPNYRARVLVKDGDGSVEVYTETDDDAAKLLIRASAAFTLAEDIATIMPRGK